jgi:ribosomal protein L40E
MEPSGDPEISPSAQPPANVPDEGETYTGQVSGGALFKLKCIWLFLLGAILSLIGLYCLLYRPDIGQNSFIIMLMGLFFTAAGSIYGKRKLAGQAGVADYVVDPQQMLQVRPTLPVQQAQPVQPATQTTSYPQAQPDTARPAPGQPAVTPAPAEIRKIFVCPQCGAENEMKDKFCYKCGYNLETVKKKHARPKKQASKKSGKGVAKPASKPAAKIPAQKAVKTAKKKSSRAESKELQ